MSASISVEDMSHGRFGWLGDDSDPSASMFDQANAPPDQTVCADGQTPDIHGVCCPIAQLNSDGTCAATGQQGSANINPNAPAASAPASSPASSSSSGSGINWASIFGGAATAVKTLTSGGGPSPAPGVKAAPKAAAAATTSWGKYALIAGGIAAFGVTGLLVVRKVRRKKTLSKHLGMFDGRRRSRRRRRSA